MKRMMLLLVLAVTVLTGCNTVRGVGKDVQAGDGHLRVDRRARLIGQLRGEVVRFLQLLPQFIFINPLTTSF